MGLSEPVANAVPEAVAIVEHLLSQLVPTASALLMHELGLADGIMNVANDMAGERSGDAHRRAHRRGAAHRARQPRVRLSAAR